jgi:ubiquinone biosynthesis protein COQ4
MDCFWEGKRNGAAAAKIVEQDIMALLREPLTEARARLGIQPPVIYKETLAAFEAAGDAPLLAPLVHDEQAVAA